jgi:hypothetical protein
MRGLAPAVGVGYPGVRPLHTLVPGSARFCDRCREWRSATGNPKGPGPTRGLAPVVGYSRPGKSGNGPLASVSTLQNEPVRWSAWISATFVAVT